MNTISIVKTDVLVIGAGLAGAASAACAAESGADVTIVSEGNIFSGSSFGHGNWSLALNGPVDENDVDNFVEQILTVGRGMAKKELAETVMSNVMKTATELKRFGIEYIKPENSKTKEYIPCFDRKERNWNWLKKAEMVEKYGEAFDRLGVHQLDHTEVLQIDVNENSVCGAYATREGRLLYIRCSAIIMASGGMGSLFKYNYGNDTIAVMGQYLALKAGAKLTNLEFMQLMPGFINPAPKTLFNERAYKFSVFHDPATGEEVKNGTSEEWAEALEVRSSHGPFTSEFISRIIDVAIYKTQIRNGIGVNMNYLDSFKDYDSPFMKGFFEWLEKDYGVTKDQSVLLGCYYHASNGGILINKNAETTVKGLFACGEATSGMHGADRIGGTSTSNCVTFGTIAGRSAADYSKNAGNSSDAISDIELYTVPNADSCISEIQDIAFKNMMVCRNEAGLTAAIDRINQIEAEFERNMQIVDQLTPESASAVLKTRQLESMILVSKVLANAMLIRKESRGSHYREDYPCHDDSLECNIVEYLKDGNPIVEFEKI